MKIIRLFLILFLFSCSNQPATPLAENESPLEKKEQTIELSYTAWACDCANWATADDIHKFSDNIDDTLAELSVFIEPAISSLELPDTLGCNGDIVKFTGHFYKEKGFPEGYHSFEPVDAARVFQYTSYSVIKSNHWELMKATKTP
jgi:hypothetical protein